jgi:hypothetical protein
MRLDGEPPHGAIAERHLSHRGIYVGTVELGRFHPSAIGHSITLGGEPTLSVLPSSRISPKDLPGLVGVLFVYACHC